MSEPSVDKNVYSTCGKACVLWDDTKARRYWALVGGGHTKDRAKAQRQAEKMAELMR